MFNYVAQVDDGVAVTMVMQAAAAAMAEVRWDGGRATLFLR